MRIFDLVQAATISCASCPSFLAYVLF